MTIISYRYLQKLTSSSAMQITILCKKDSCSSRAKKLGAGIMQRDASNRNAWEKNCNFPHQNSRKLCDSSDQNCVVPVLLHLLQRRCMSSLASGNLALHNKRFYLERVKKFLDLATKSDDISRTVRARAKVTHTVSIRATVELGNTQGTITK